MRFLVHQRFLAHLPHRRNRPGLLLLFFMFFSLHLLELLVSLASVLEGEQLLGGSRYQAPLRLFAFAVALLDLVFLIFRIYICTSYT